MSKPTILTVDDDPLVSAAITWATRPASMARPIASSAQRRGPKRWPC